MNISEMLVTISQTAEAQPGLFPFPFKMHLIFCCLSLVFFIFQFVTEKKPYQLIMAVAIPFSLTIWLSENRTLFYVIGIVEAVLLLAAFVSAIVFKNKYSENSDETEASDSSQENEASNDSAESENSQADETETSDNDDDESDIPSENTAEEE